MLLGNRRMGEESASCMYIIGDASMTYNDASGLVMVTSLLIDLRGDIQTIGVSHILSCVTFLLVQHSFDSSC
jgi:hypothetical protein